MDAVCVCDPPLSLCLVFYGLILADGFTVFHGHLGLVGPHLFALPKIVYHKKTLSQSAFTVTLTLKAASDS